MIIDAHTHLGRPGGALDSRATDLLKSMDQGKIDKALVFAGRINSITTEQVIEEIAPYKDRLFAIGSISFETTYTYVETLRKVLQHLDDLLASGAIRGLKFYPGYEHFYPAEPSIRCYLELAEKHNRPVIFHSGDTLSSPHLKSSKLKYALPIHVDDLAVEMPELKIVIAHMGYPWQREAAEVVYKNANVYADCSGFFYGEPDPQTSEHFGKVLREFIDIAGNYDKLLFGSDWPVSNQVSYRGVMERYVPTGEKDTFFHGTAERLFGI
jgi:uncharacterized protein